jgi:hypothetical protein
LRSTLGQTENTVSQTSSPASRGQRRRRGFVVSLRGHAATRRAFAAQPESAAWTIRWFHAGPVAFICSVDCSNDTRLARVVAAWDGSIDAQDSAASAHRGFTSPATSSSGRQSISTAKVERPRPADSGHGSVLTRASWQGHRTAVWRSKRSDNSKAAQSSRRDS